MKNFLGQAGLIQKASLTFLAFSQVHTKEELRKTHINMKYQHSNTGAEGRQGMVMEMLGVVGHPKCHRSMSACHCLVCPPTNQFKLIFID